MIKYIPQLLSVNNWIKLTDVKHIFPYYHLVNDENRIHISNLYSYKKVKEFELDLDFYLKNYEPACFSEIEMSIPKNGKPKFFLSFDDGLSECYDIIAPILLKKGIPATFFVNPDFIDNKSLFVNFKYSIFIEYIKKSTNQIKDKITKEFTFYNEKEKTISSLLNSTENINYFLDILNLDFDKYLEKEKPFMTTNQIKNLVKQGFIIGAHSLNHAKYNKISFDEQIYQTKTGIEYVNNNFDIKNKLFAFPFSDIGVSKEFFDYIFQNNIADFTFGIAGIKDDPEKRHIQRIPVERNKNIIENYILKQYLFYFAKKLLRKNYVKR